MRCEQGNAGEFDRDLVCLKGVNGYAWRKVDPGAVPLAEAFARPMVRSSNSAVSVFDNNGGRELARFQVDGQLILGDSPVVTRAELEQLEHRAAFMGAAEGTAAALVVFFAVRAWLAWARRRLWLSHQEGRAGVGGAYRTHPLVGGGPRPPAPERAKG